MRTLALAALIAITGCAAQQQTEMQAQANAGRAQCDAAIPKIQGNYVKRAVCINDAIVRAGFTGPAQGLENAKRVALSKRVDRGEISPAEAQSEFAETVYRVQQDAAAQRTANAQAAAAILGAMPRPGPQAPPVPYQIPVRQPWTANCYNNGPYTTCNGN